MSNRDSLPNIEWPFSPTSQDDSSLDLPPSSPWTPRRNPYNKTITAIPAPITMQQLYTETTKAMQPSIKGWLTHATRQPSTPTNAKLSSLPTTKLWYKWQPQKHIQMPLHKLLDNEHRGDIPTTNPMYFQVISKNVNSLSTADHNLQWHGAIHAMVEMDAHVLCIQESNLHWTDGLCQPIYRLFQKAFMHAKISTSNSIDTGQGTYQPGGTFLMTLGCYPAWVLTTGKDTSGMGWWTYQELTGKCNKCYLIITAYCVGPQQPTIGSQMAYTQQYNILLSNHILNPDPRKQFVMDIIAFVCRWQPTHNILLCLDANNNTTESKDKGIERIIDEANLINLHWYHHPQLPQPATYSQGHITIDYCLGTNGFAAVLTRAWMLPFGLPTALSGDHRTMGLEFDHNILFGLNSIPNGVKV